MGPDILECFALFVSGRVVRWEGGKGGMIVKWKGGEGGRVMSGKVEKVREGNEAARSER